VVFFGQKDPEFVNRLIDEGRRQICERAKLDEETFKAETISVVVDEAIFGPWAILFIAERNGRKVHHWVFIDPETMM
jgi:hypothetical protein